MWNLLFESYGCLLRIGLAMQGKNGMRALHDAVRAQPLIPPGNETRCDPYTLFRAMDLACVFYLYRVLCLQRAAATTILLRRHGFSAEMVVGIKQFPFRSHAWVEVEGSIANDKPYLREIYQELQRC